MSQQATESQHLETAEADTPVWLVKVPKFLASEWTRLAAGGGEAGGAVLGSIKFKSDVEQPNGQTVPEAFTFHTKEGAEGIPTRYQVIELSGGSEHTHVFSPGENGESSLTGKVAKRFDVRPQRNLTENSQWETNWGKVDIDPTYCKLSRERYAAANRKTRTLVQINEQRRTAHLGKYTAKRPNEPAKGQRPSDVKRVRMDKEALEKLIFTLFEKKENWSFSDLIEETDQPTMWLKQVLLGVAELVRKGLSKGTYELKPEYKVAP